MFYNYITAEAKSWRRIWLRDLKNQELTEKGSASQHCSMLMSIDTGTVQYIFFLRKEKFDTWYDET